MKKGLLLVGALILSTSVFAASAHDAAEGIVEVKAKVVEPLKMETTPLDYGMMIPGQTIDYAEKLGSVKITGTPGERVKIELKASEADGYSHYIGSKELRNVELTTGNGTAENEKMISQTTMLNNDAGQADAGIEKTGVVNLGETGERNFIVSGRITAAQNQKPGNYTGQLHVRAMYE